MEVDVSTDDADLVAYLDGELPLADKLRLEERLAREPQLREHLARLESSWKYLELLDMNSMNKDLVETTLETVIVQAEKSVHQMRAKKRWRRPWKLFAVGFFVFFLFMFAFRFGEIHAPDNHFLLRIASPLIERLDMYLMLLDDDPDLEMLRILTQQRVFLPPLPDGTPPVKPEQYWPSQSVQVLDQFTLHPTFAELKRRVKRIESLDETLYNQFYWNNKRFHTLSWEKKHRLKVMHESIEKSPGRHDLYRTLQNYYTWFKSLQSYEKLPLREKSLSVSERVERIASLKKHLETNQGQLYAAPLTTDFLKFDGNDQEIEHLAAILSQLDPQQLDQILDASPDQTISLLLQLDKAEEETDKNKEGQLRTNVN